MKILRTTLDRPAPTPVNNSPCIKYGFKDGPASVLTNTLTTIAGSASRAR